MFSSNLNEHWSITILMIDFILPVTSRYFVDDQPPIAPPPRTTSMQQNSMNFPKPNENDRRRKKK